MIPPKSTQSVSWSQNEQTQISRGSRGDVYPQALSNFCSLSFWVVVRSRRPGYSILRTWTWLDLLTRHIGMLVDSDQQEAPPSEGRKSNTSIWLFRGSGSRIGTGDRPPKPCVERSAWEGRWVQAPRELAGSRPSKERSWPKQAGAWVPGGSRASERRPKLTPAALHCALFN
jgi:hypothetical protein